jgi:hypothetical protein
VKQSLGSFAKGFHILTRLKSISSADTRVDRRTDPSWLTVLVQTIGVALPCRAFLQLRGTLGGGGEINDAHLLEIWIEPASAEREVVGMRQRGVTSVRPGECDDDAVGEAVAQSFGARVAALFKALDCCASSQSLPLRAHYGRSADGRCNSEAEFEATGPARCEVAQRDGLTQANIVTDLARR